MAKLKIFGVPGCQEEKGVRKRQQSVLTNEYLDETGRLVEAVGDKWGAERMHLAQPSLSQQMQKLEAQVGHSFLKA
jgi:hypothetical protein